MTLPWCAQSQRCNSHLGPPTRATPDRWALRHSQIFLEATMAPVSNPQNAMVGDNGTVPTTKVLAWTAASRLEPGSLANIVRPLPLSTNPWDQRLTTCSSSFTTFLTLLYCTPER